MPRYAQDRVLTASEVMLMSDVSSVSFDGRYFGPIDLRQVEAVIEPLYTWSTSTESSESSETTALTSSEVN